MRVAEAHPSRACAAGPRQRHLFRAARFAAPHCLSWAGSVLRSQRFHLAHSTPIDHDYSLLSRGHGLGGGFCPLGWCCVATPSRPRLARRQHILSDEGSVGEPRATAGAQGRGGQLGTPRVLESRSPPSAPELARPRSTAGGPWMTTRRPTAMELGSAGTAAGATVTTSPSGCRDIKFPGRLRLHAKCPSVF